MRATSCLVCGFEDQQVGPELVEKLSRQLVDQAATPTGLPFGRTSSGAWPTSVIRRCKNTSAGSWAAWQFHDPKAGEGFVQAFRLQSPETSRHRVAYSLNVRSTFASTIASKENISW